MTWNILVGRAFTNFLTHISGYGNIFGLGKESPNFLVFPIMQSQSVIEPSNRPGLEQPATPSQGKHWALPGPLVLFFHTYSLGNLRGKNYCSWGCCGHHLLFSASWPFPLSKKGPSRWYLVKVTGATTGFSQNNNLPHPKYALKVVGPQWDTSFRSKKRKVTMRDARKTKVMRWSL